MNTPAHLLLGAAVFAGPGKARLLPWAFLGAAIPDLSLYVLVGGSSILLGIPASTVFGELYYSNSWQTIFSIDNSFVIWLALLGVALALRAQTLIALTGAALLHLLFDFLLHHDDARRHFWPLSNWVFESPVSYWDVDHYGVFAALCALTLALGCGFLLYQRFQGYALRAAIGILCALELFAAYTWLSFPAG